MIKKKYHKEKDSKKTKKACSEKKVISKRKVQEPIKLSIINAKEFSSTLVVI